LVRGPLEDIMEEHERGREAFGSDEEFKLHSLRHSAAHILAQAVRRLYPKASFAIGPAIEDGFYYDIALDTPIAEAELAAIQAEMKKISKENQPFIQEEWDPDKARTFFRERGQNFKLELIDSFGTPTVGVYRNPNKEGLEEFVDLCKGPHVRYTSNVKHFQLTKVSGAYWRGDAKNQQLQRIYGTVWPTKEELDAYLFRIEEAKKRDHRKLGAQLGLFMFHEYAPGAAFWLEKGEHVYHKLSEMMRGLLIGDGYVSVRTPMLFDKKLWEISGHWGHYQSNMFYFREGHHETLQEAASGGTEEGDKDERFMGLKPMNCPSHALIFKSRKISYRDLPLRIHDQGVLHRNEARGALGGLTRVRQFCQDDAHLFMAPEQLQPEIQRLLELVSKVYHAFDMTYVPKLATRPPDRMGDESLWDTAESALKEALDRNGIAWKINEGDGTFYGPKIDFEVHDALGRAHQCATLQIDFNMANRFDLTYTGADNQPHRPVVIHRAIFGSFERFIGVLIEHYAGKFPVWLAPEQVRVMTVSEKSNDGGRRVLEALQAAGLMATFDDSDNKIGYKIREAHGQLLPYMAVIGEREQEERTVSVRSRDHGDLGSMTLDAFVERVRTEAAAPF
jgi:threonyl-tRNA synthetase